MTQVTFTYQGVTINVPSEGDSSLPDGGHSGVWICPALPPMTERQLLAYRMDLPEDHPDVDLVYNATRSAP